MSSKKKKKVRGNWNNNKAEKWKFVHRENVHKKIVINAPVLFVFIRRFVDLLLTKPFNVLQWYIQDG